MLDSLTAAILGHVLAGFIGGAANFCLGYWFAQRQLKRASASLESAWERETEAIRVLTGDEYVQIKLRKHQ